MSKQVCPKCGRVEPDPSARFCDTDGTTLVPHQEPVVATPAPAPATSARKFPLGIVLGGGGLVLLGVAGWLLLTTEAKVDTSKTDVKISTEGKAQPAKGSPTAQALRKCFGDKIPKIPKRGSSGADNGFELFKDITRVGTDVVVGTATPKLTLEQERKVGKRVAKELERKYGVVARGAAAERLQRIVGRLVRQAHRHKKLVYVFKMLRSNDVNAFMAPGGKGYVFKGLAKKMPDDDDLAFIIGHELAHSELRHSEKAVRVAMAGRKLGEAMGKGGGQIGETLSSFTMNIVQQTYDQDQEFEADRLGLCLSVLAGFDKSGGVDAFKIMKRGSGRRKKPRDASGRIAYDILSTHPELPRRITYQKLLQKKLKR